MKVSGKKIKFIFGLFITVLFLNSCILDEFKFNEIQLKEEWNMDIVSPLFQGDFEFKDLIYDWNSVVFQTGGPNVGLRFSTDSVLIIPSQIIFEPAVIIDNFNFFINGDYNLASVALEYTVSNGCPFPLNFQMRFNNKNSNIKGPPVLPPSFLAANFDGLKFIPETSKHTISLNNEQLQSFKTSNRIEFSTWFDSSDLINQQDTFLSDYPVEISIVLYGEVEGRDEN